jgi:hypothetical protein
MLARWAFERCFCIVEEDLMFQIVAGCLWRARAYRGSAIGPGGDAAPGRQSALKIKWDGRIQDRPRAIAQIAGDPVLRPEVRRNA